MRGAAQKYQAVQITTANPGELLVSLYDGLFRFLNVAALAMRNKRRAQAGESLSKAHAIVSELSASLEPSFHPELCDNLYAVYMFCLDRITFANLHNEATAIDEVLRVLAPVREAFTTVVRNGSAAAEIDGSRK